MAKTQIADIIEPTIFRDSVVERTAENSRFFQSGIIERTAEFDALASGKGRTFHMPFWHDLTGASQALSDAAALIPKKMDQGQDIAHKHFRGDAWAANDLAQALAGSDPLREVANAVGDYWARDMQTTILLPTLKGIFATALATTHVLDLASETGLSAVDANLIGSDAVIDAAGLLGDAWEKIVAMAMHSKPFQRLQKMNLIEFVPLAGQNINIPMFLGRQVIVSDGMPRVAGSVNGFKYTTYLFGAGAAAFGEGGPPSLETGEAVETDRDSLAGDDILINRRHFILHFRGVKFVGSPAGVTPSVAELEAGANHTKVWEDKNIPIIKLVTNG